MLYVYNCPWISTTLYLLAFRNVVTDRISQLAGLDITALFVTQFYENTKQPMAAWRLHSQQLRVRDYVSIYFYFQTAPRISVVWVSHSKVHLKIFSNLYIVVKVFRVKNKVAAAITCLNYQQRHDKQAFPVTIYKLFV